MSESLRGLEDSAVSYSPLLLQVNYWHIISPEYAPQPGGVADYTKQVAEGLRKAGDFVQVWCRSRSEPCNTDPDWVHRDLRKVSFLDLWRITRKIRQYSGRRRLLVQWVPHGFGWRSMNILFCCWLLWLAWSGDEIDVMVHEPFLSFREGSLKQDLAACVHRVMAIVLLGAATRVWVSTLAWEKKLRPFAMGRRITFGWLPVPSNIPVERNAGIVHDIRKQLTGSYATVLGHFSSYNPEVTAMLRKILPPLLIRRKTCIVQLLGRGSDRFRDEMIEAYPALSERIVASGHLSSDLLSTRLAACDLVLLPYPDGVTTRRTTMMATLEHGVPVVTTLGKLSEQLWANCDAIATASAENADDFVLVADSLVNDQVELARLGKAASAFYADHFGLSRVIRDLRSAEIPKAAA